MSTADVNPSDPAGIYPGPDEERLHLALDAARMAIWELDAATDQVTVSPSRWISENLPNAYTRISREEGFALVHPDDVSRYRAEFDDAIRRQADFASEFRVVRPGDRKVFWLVQHAKCCPGERGLRFIGVVQDVTDQREGEAALRASQARLAAIFARAAVGLSELSLDGQILQVNDEVCRVLGRSRESLVGVNVRGITYEQDLPRTNDGWSRLLQTGRPVSLDKRYVRADGSLVWANSILSRLDDAAGRPMGVLVVTVELTSRVAALEDLRQSEAVFRTLGETVPALLWLSDGDGRPIYENPAWRVYTGKSSQDLANLGWEAIPHPDDLPWLMETWQRARETAEPFEIVFRCRRHDGEYRWFLSRARPVKDATGRVMRWVGAMVDIDDQKRLHEALRQADRRKDEFLATLAHELRNPLAPLLNSLDALRLAGESDAANLKHYATMGRQLDNLVRLVDDLLEVSRITSGKIELRRELVDLTHIAQDAVEISRPRIEAARHAFELVAPADPVVVNVDPFRMRQVVSNLLNNSAKYTPPCGNIRLELSADSRSATICVRDDGVGIEREMLPRVFEMFLQTDRDHKSAKEGLGIGLAIVKSLVELQGGRIEAKSEGIGKGCEFTVKIPLAESSARGIPLHAPAAALLPEPADARSGKRRVLVVDDNEDAAASVEAVLTFLGGDVKVVTDSELALEAIASHAPDLILLDLGMPGMSGYEVARLVRSRPELKDVKLVALTGWGQAEDRQRTEAAGFDFHLLKPVDVMALKRLLAGG